MKTEITTTYYRGHQIDTTTITPEQGCTDRKYSTATSEIDASILSDNAKDTFPTDSSQPSTIRIWATADAARKTSEATIEDMVGPAEPEELGEAAYDLANSAGDKGWSERNAKRLADAITSLLASDTSTSELARGLRQIATNLTNH